jgi:hypothetical protein
MERATSPTDSKINLRMPAQLRGELERESEERGLTLNAVILDRIQMFRAPHLLALFQMMASAATRIEQITGRSCTADTGTYFGVRAAWQKIIDEVWLPPTDNLKPLTDLIEGLEKGTVQPTPEAFAQLRKLREELLPSVSSGGAGLQQYVETLQAMGTAQAAEILKDRERGG